jgi:hypothetical protein
MNENVNVVLESLTLGEVHFSKIVPLHVLYGRQIISRNHRYYVFHHSKLEDGVQRIVYTETQQPLLIEFVDLEETNVDSF